MMSEAHDIIDANGLPRLHEMMSWYEVEAADATAIVERT